VSDNGIGMDQHIIDKYFSHVGSSFYRSSEFYALQAKHKMSFQPISRFGIDILSVFMVSDCVTVETRRLYGPHSSSDPLEIRIEGLESVFWVLDGTRDQPGTTITLSLRQTHPWAEMNATERIDAIVKAVPHPPFPIRIMSGNETRAHDGADFRRAQRRNSSTSSTHVLTIDIDITENSLGLAGMASVFILQEDGRPCAEVELFSREVTVGGFSPVEVRTTLDLGVNEIVRHADSLEIAEDDVCTSHGYSSEVGSQCEIAVHDISVPMNLLRRIWEAPRSGTRLSYPFAMNLCVDVVDSLDLDLNTARSEILFGDKWLEFTQSLSFIICRGVRRAVEPAYWKELMRIWRGQSNIDYFLHAIERADSENVFS
jgi:molecular chaperone HtpG